MSYEPREDLVGFCSAPWTDCISYADGELRACDRNKVSFGNWQKDGLRNTWEGESFQDFRRAIREGRYPDEDCASCHNNGTQRHGHGSLIGAFSIHYAFLMSYFGRSSDEQFEEIKTMYEMLSLQKRTEETDRKLAAYFASLDKLKAENAAAFDADPKFRLALTKLRVIGECWEDYLQGALKPRRLAPFRQSQLEAKCTARCVMCLGKYTREIEIGPTMDKKWVGEAFADLEDITDFWCNGAEYLFYREWKQVALMLRNEGVRMRVSTNGILLTEPTIDFMVENDLLGFLTLSLDGATKETVESTRIRVNFDKNVQRIRYLLRRTTEAGQAFEFVGAFVMMKRNLRELPAFIRLLHGLMPENCVAKVIVLCQPLENFDVTEYRRFVHNEHHSLLGEAELKRIFTEAVEAQRGTNVAITFYNQHLKEFVEAGMPFPRYFPRQSDVDMFLDDVRHGRAMWKNEELDVKQLVRNSKFCASAFPREMHRFVREYFEKTNSVLAETYAAFPEFASELEKLLPAYSDVFAKQFMAEENDAMGRHGPSRVQRYPLGPVHVGDFIYSYVSGDSGQIIRLDPEFALLHDGTIVPLGETLHLLTKESPRPLVPERRTWREEAQIALGHFYLNMHSYRNRLLGGVKSPLLWKLSVAYRKILGWLGVNVAFTGPTGR